MSAVARHQTNDRTRHHRPISLSAGTRPPDNAAAQFCVVELSNMVLRTENGDGPREGREFVPNLSRVRRGGRAGGIEVREGVQQDLLDQGDVLLALRQGSVVVGLEGTKL